MKMRNSICECSDAMWWWDSLKNTKIWVNKQQNSFWHHIGQGKAYVTETSGRLQSGVRLLNRDTFHAIRESKSKKSTRITSCWATFFLMNSLCILFPGENEWIGRLKTRSWNIKECYSCKCKQPVNTENKILQSLNHICRMHEKQHATPASCRQRVIWNQSVVFRCEPDEHFVVT